MTINRDNYEEYFLLYTDNELSEQERFAVEDFAQQNPDLQKELVMLRESILIPDAITFENKGSLLHNEHAGAGIQEKLLLLLDNELDAENSQKIQSAIVADNEITKEWRLLQLTQLSVLDKIIFTDKAILYKKEKGKIIPIGWRKIAVAAVLIGFGLWGTVTYFNKGTAGSGSNGVAVKIPLPPLPNEIIKGGQHAGDTKDSITAISVADDGQADSRKTAPSVKNSNIEKSAGSKKEQPDGEIVIKDPTSINKKPSNNLPVPELEKINSKDGNNIEVVTVQPLKKHEITQLDNSIVSDAAQSYPVTNTSFAENKDEKITYGFEEDQPKKGKAGGFFKRLNRVLQRKANIKTGSGDSFKVANLSFAVQ